MSDHDDPNAERPVGPGGTADEPTSVMRTPADEPTAALDAKAEECARRLGLAYERRFTGYGDLAVTLGRVAV